MSLLGHDHYLACVVKGAELVRRLEEGVLVPLPAGPSINQYELEEGTLTEKGLLRVELLEMGISDQFNWVEVRKAILAKENFKARGTKEPPNIVPLEALWQSYLHSQRHVVPPGHLVPITTIVRCDVINQSSRTAIWEANRNSSCTFAGPKGYRIYTNVDPGFWGILGSVNGASTLRMLINHKAEIGFRTIEKVILFGCNEGLEDSAKTRSLPPSLPIYELERVREWLELSRELC